MKTEASLRTSWLLGVLARASRKTDRAREACHVDAGKAMEALADARGCIEAAHRHALRALELLESAELVVKKPEAE